MHKALIVWAALHLFKKSELGLVCKKNKRENMKPININAELWQS